jgi:hypothetical protein
MRKKNPGLLRKKIRRKHIEAARLRSGKFGLLNQRSYELVLTEWRNKVLTALFLVHGIDRASPDGWRQLAIALALKYVPAFQDAKKTGSKGGTYDNLVRDVADVRKRNALKSDKAAIEALQGEGKYQGDINNVLARLREARALLRVQEKLEEAVPATRLDAEAWRVARDEAPAALEEAAIQKKRRN